LTSAAAVLLHLALEKKKKKQKTNLTHQLVALVEVMGSAALLYDGLDGRIIEWTLAHFVPELHLYKVCGWYINSAGHKSP
jgi:hypothetical protein